MFQNIEPISKEKHSGLKIHPVNHFKFAEKLTFVPLSFSEISIASRHYPIVFSAQGTPTPLAILGINQEQNVFVDGDGNWTAPYIPVHIRRYPFILGETKEENNFVVCIDPDAPHFSTEEGEPLFGEDGEGTAIMKRAGDLLKKYHQEMVTTQQMFKLLDEKELFKEKQVNIGRGKEQKAAIKGFKAVDTKMLGEMDNETLGDWVKKGIMGLVYAHLHSFENLKDITNAASAS